MWPAGANKALIAKHGNEIFAAAAKNVLVAYEALRRRRHSHHQGNPRRPRRQQHPVADGYHQRHLRHFILTEMREKSRAFADVLKEAQALGYAEADPTFDIEGIDAAHKLTILASIAFGIPLQFEKTQWKAFPRITQEDIRYADELGYRIKHLGISRKMEKASSCACIRP